MLAERLPSSVFWAVIVAAGKSSRLAAEGLPTPKQFMEHKGLPLFWHSACSLAANPLLQGIVFVLPDKADAWGQPLLEQPLLAWYEQEIARLASTTRFPLLWKVVLGGARRQDSVRHGLSALPEACNAVLVHDAARPFVSPALVQRVIEALRQGHAGVVPGVAVADTIKELHSDQTVACTHNRAGLRAIQTPQGFALGPLRQAHARAEAQGLEVTDDAALLEACAVPILVVPGEISNRKITTAEDLSLLCTDNAKTAWLPCTGQGYDVHRYGGDKPFILGGVPIATPITVAAHSDGDTLLHALMDAMLGCIGGGDIGGLFPDSDPAYAGISSGILLAEVRERVERAGVRLVHADITVIAQTPRIAPHRESIAKNVATLLRLPRNAVNVKATTEEHLGFTGEKKGIKVMAIVTALRQETPRE